MLLFSNLHFSDRYFEWGVVFQYVVWYCSGFSGAGYGRKFVVSSHRSNVLQGERQIARPSSSDTDCEDLRWHISNRSPQRLTHIDPSIALSDMLLVFQERGLMRYSKSTTNI